MQLEKSLASVAAFAKPEKFEDLRRNIDVDWIEQALQVTGTATIRRRRLPAEQVVWLVIGMALFRNRSIHDVVSKLDLVLPGGKPTVVPSAVADARSRLGARAHGMGSSLDARTSGPTKSARDHAWRGLAIYGVDGSTLRVPDSDENRLAFGGANSRRGESGYPLVRIAALMALRSHLLGAASFGPFADGEHTYAGSLWASVPSDSITIVDRNFLAAPVLVPLQRDGKNRHWLVRAKSNTRWRVLRRINAHENLVELESSSQARENDPSLPRTYTARAIRYQRKGFEPQTLLTSLIDQAEYPRSEVVALYHERWEIELGYDEIKTEMLDREEAIRSRTPEGVHQELWGILIAYNADSDLKWSVSLRGRKSSLHASGL